MLPVVVFTTKYTDSALTAVGSASAANKGINDLLIKKEGIYASMLDLLSIINITSSYFTLC